MHLTLHLTTDCNMRCDYCYAPPRAGSPMSLETARKALELGSGRACVSSAHGPQAVSEGTTRASTGVVLFGGEPLLHKKLIRDVVSNARELERTQAGRFHFKLTTNGLLLDDEFIDLSIQEDILIAMSFDGVREAHDWHRRLRTGGPSFDILLEKLELLLAARPYSSILLVVNPDTAHLLPDSVQFLIERSARYLIVSLNYAASWEEEDFQSLERAYRKLAKLYVQWTEAGRKFYLSPFEVKLSSHINRHSYRKERCELARRQLSVAPDGHLYPCVQFPAAGSQSEWCIGHVSTGIDEPRREALRLRSEAEKEPCNRCAIEARCNNSCGCLNWQSTGSVATVSPVLCRHERMLVPIADEVGRTLYRRRTPLFIQKHYNAAYPVLSLLEDLSAGNKPSTSQDG